MEAGQRLVYSGYEVMLYPATRLFMTQDEGSDFSHALTKNIDIVSWNPVTQKYKKGPLYAPCSCKCVAIWDPNSNNRVFTSLDKVWTPSGLSIVTFAMAHDDNPIASIGDTFTQGDLIAHTGTTGKVTGDHCHYNIALGSYTGYQRHVYQGKSRYDLKGSISVWLGCYVNDTTIIQGYGHNWQTFQGGEPPGPGPGPGPAPSLPKVTRFPWVLYSNKLRNKVRKN